MRGTTRLALLGTMLVSGCVHTQPHPLTSPEGRAEINARAVRGHAVLTLASERGQQVRGLHIAPDVTTWTDENGEAHSAPTEDVVAVTFRRDGTGALKGLGIGVGIGAAFGLLLSITDSGNDSFLDFSPAFYVGTYSLGGAVLSTTIGAIHSDRHVYRLPSEVPLLEEPAAAPPPR